MAAGSRSAAEQGAMLRLPWRLQGALHYRREELLDLQLDTQVDSVIAFAPLINPRERREQQTEVELTAARKK